MRSADRERAVVGEEVLIQPQRHGLASEGGEVSLDGLPLALFSADDEPLLDLLIIDAGG